MVRTAESLAQSLDELADREPVFAKVIASRGRPQPRYSDPGPATLLRTIIGQQVSVAAARSMWSKLTDRFGEVVDLEALAQADDQQFREVGLSRQKTSYARSLAGLVLSGELDLSHLPVDDEAAIAELIKIKGIGRWSAEIYLLFAEGRPDSFPAGDLAVQVELGRLLGHPQRPSETLVREWAEKWRPHRGAAAILAWHSYNSTGTAL